MREPQHWQPYFYFRGASTSQFPLLDEESAIADSSFTGRYDIVISDDKTPMHIVVYLMDKKYLLEAKWKVGFYCNSAQLAHGLIPRAIAGRPFTTPDETKYSIFTFLHVYSSEKNKLWSRSQSRSVLNWDQLHRERHSGPFEFR